VNRFEFVQNVLLINITVCNLRRTSGAAMKTANGKLNMVVVADCRRLAVRTFELFVRDAKRAIKSRQCFCVALSRDLPADFFKLLAAELKPHAVLWDRIHFFLVDQCCGPADLSQNRYCEPGYMFTGKIGIPAGNEHVIGSVNNNCALAASIYEQTIYDVVKPRKNGIPRFDLIVLKMYEDGHIASLFSDTYAFFDTKGLVQVLYFMDKRHTRITMTNPVFRAAFHVIVTAWGRQNKSVLKHILADKGDQIRYGIDAIRPICNRVTWLIDISAADFVLSAQLPKRQSGV